MVWLQPSIGPCGTPLSLATFCVHIGAAWFPGTGRRKFAVRTPTRGEGSARRGGAHSPSSDFGVVAQAGSWAHLDVHGAVLLADQAAMHSCRKWDLDGGPPLAPWRGQRPLRLRGFVCSFDAFLADNKLPCTQGSRSHVPLSLPPPALESTVAHAASSWYTRVGQARLTPVSMPR